MSYMPRAHFTLFFALFALGACHGSAPTGGSNVTMRDMEVVDGTANDAMVDLDNIAQEGTSLVENGAASGTTLSGSDSAAAPTGNASAPVVKPAARKPAAQKPVAVGDAPE